MPEVFGDADAGHGLLDGGVDPAQDPGGFAGDKAGQVPEHNGQEVDKRPQGQDDQGQLPGDGHQDNKENNNQQNLGKNLGDQLDDLDKLIGI